MASLSIRVTTEDIDVAYRKLFDATEMVFHRRTDYDQARLIRDKRVNDALFTNRIEGRNEQLREAAGRNAFPELYEDVDDTRRLLSQAEHTYNLAKLDYDLVDRQLRFFEALSRLTAAGQQILLGEGR